MSEAYEYRDAVAAIKTAILQAQSQAAQSVNDRQLALYFAIGGYVSANTRNGVWGTGAVDVISEQLQREMPGLRGFSSRNLKNMRAFFEEWSFLLADSGSFSLRQTADEETNSLQSIRQLQLPNWSRGIPEGFMEIGFTHHIAILSAIKPLDERFFYIREAACNHYSVAALKRAIADDDFHHQGALPNNFMQVMPEADHAKRAVLAFKDEYLLDFINVEELGARDLDDVDERLLEQGIVHNVKNFIMAFGRDFTFVGNQYHLEAFGVDQYIDLLFFNRELNCLVAVELKTGPFKTSYLGQLSGYLSILDGFVKKDHENNSIGIVLCRDANKAFVDYVIHDYDKPMGVATYKTSKDMSQELLNALPPMDELQALLEGKAEGGDC